ncbi:unnamed protein product, partial [Staurois parvus]
MELQPSHREVQAVQGSPRQERLLMRRVEEKSPCKITAVS